MKRLLLSIVIIFAAIIAIGGFAQHLFDWNQYRDELTVHVSSVIGRQFEIKGDIKIAVLPSPVLLVKDVHLTNVEGASDADMLILESIEVHVALAPLLGRNIQVTSIKLVNPVLNIEFLEEGENNFSLGQKNAADPKSTNQGSATNSQLPVDDAFSSVYRPSIGGFSVQIDNFLVENGTMNYRDTPNMYIEQIQKINGQFRLASLDGPMDAKGQAVVRGFPISFAGSVGQIVQGRTLPFNLATSFNAGEVKTDFTGSISNIKESPQITGKFEVNGRSFGNLFLAKLGGMHPPELFARPFNAQAKVFLDKNILKFKELAIHLDNIKGSGSAEMTLGSNIDANLALSLKKLDLDALLTRPSRPNLKTLQSTEDRTPKKTKRTNQFGLDTHYTTTQNNSEPLGLSSLPETLSINLNLSIDELTYNDRPIRHAKLNATLANKEITLSQISALFPGNTDVALFGFVTQTEKKPAFDGTIELATKDPRRLLKWLGAGPFEISKDRLQTLVFSSKIQANKNFIDLSKIQMRVDGTKVRGSTKIAFKDRPTIGAVLAIDKINLDAYLPKGLALTKNLPATKAKTALKSSPAAQPRSNSNPLAIINTLGGFDITLKAKINSLTLKGVPVYGVKVDSTLIGGNLMFHNWTVQNLVGIRGRITGNLSGLKGAPQLFNPIIDNFTIDARGKSLARFFKLLGIKPRIEPKKIGPVRLTISLNGEPSNLKININLKALKGAFTLAGKAKPFDPIPSVNGQMKLRHPDLQKLLRAFDVSYQPAMGKLGSINLSSRLTGSAKALSLNRIAGTAAGLKLRGNLDVKLDGLRPSIRANLTTSGIDLDNLFPLKWKTFLFQGQNLEHALRPNPRNSLLHQVSWQRLPLQLNYPIWGDPVTIRNKRRWSISPIDLTYLSFFDADVSLKTPRLIFNNFKFENLDLAVKLKNGILDLHRATGRLFGGDLKLNSKVTALPREDRYQTKFSLKRLDMPLALRSFGDKTLKSGIMEVIGNLRTGGSNVADMISRMNGSGSLSLSGVDVSSGSGQGSFFSGVTALFASLNQFAGSHTRKAGREKADLRGSFKINKGIAKFNDLILTSGIGTGSAKGFVDLPNWYINARGNLKLSDNFLLEMLTRELRPQLIPFTVSGLLNKPNVRLDTSKVSSGRILIPGNISKKVDKVLKKKGIGSVLEQILPFPRSTAPDENSSSRNSSTQQESAPPKPRPEDLLKNLLKGLIR